jgi:predicted AAA+ superfamily ATPase
MDRKRLYDNILSDNLARHRQMAFVAGPRQVGKTTTCRALGSYYHNWDNLDDRQLILGGPAQVADRDGIAALEGKSKTIVFDELHRYRKWKGFLKGFFDTYADRFRVVVTGSSRLDVYRRGGDSLMGRYFLYRMHPFSVAETLDVSVPSGPVRPPREIASGEFEALWDHGGFPEPFLKRDSAFTNRWKALRRHQLVREDLRDLTRIQELGHMEVLVRLLSERTASLLSLASLAKAVGVSFDTIRRWMDILESMHVGFRVRPWAKGVERSLRKEPKWYLRDWTETEDPGARAETFVACHLLKAVEGWTDLGFGTFELRYLRDKSKREVDFLVVRDGKPWFLAEVKRSETRLEGHLAWFQAVLKAPHAFQVVMEMPYVDTDCFGRHDPVVVPVRTFLSQLL